VQASVPVALWQYTADPADQARLDALRAASGYDWTSVRAFRDKEEAGHEEPWYAYLRGDNPGYPSAILAAAHAPGLLGASDPGGSRGRARSVTAK
jgi:hypothetical protein